MNQYVFHRLREGLAEAQGMADLPFPVRAEMEDEIYVGQRVRVDMLLDELDLFLAEHPEYAEVYRVNMGMLAWRLGAELGMKGYTETALHFLEMGLRHDPESLSLHVNCALALHCKGEYREALVHYEYILADPLMSSEPMVTVLAARAYYDLGEYAGAYRLLKVLAHTLPEDEAFWDFLAEVRVKAEEQGGQTAHAPGSLECTRCGRRLREGSLFCSYCGEAVERAGTMDPRGRGDGIGPSFCPYCGNKVRPGARFCRNCGKAQK
jgi:tetratricopeptide (TPR) repeat protein